jgi:[acyl-carrier-protein] S-malonyltransferase
MAAAAAAFQAPLAATPFASPRCPVTQNVLGDFAPSEPEAIRQNLRRQITGSVRWEKCARAIMTRADRLVELGPGNVLTGLMRKIDRSVPVSTIGSIQGIEAFVAAMQA